MAYFAKLDENNIVIDINVIDDEHLLDVNGVEQEALGLEFLIVWSGGYTNWKQTSQNGNFRKNYAAIGGIYDPVRDAFMLPKPDLYPSWVLDEVTCKWVPPTPMPDDGREYDWDEPTLSWVLV